MLNPSAFNLTLPPASWRDLARLCRQICVLREQGRGVEAERLQAESLAAMAEAARREGESDDALHARVTALFAVEHGRVADAAALAALLVPQLASSTAPPPIAPELQVGPRSAAPRPAPGNIADFIDDMIAQERRAS